MEFGQSLAYGLKGRVSLERVVFTGRAASSEEKNKTKNTTFESVFQKWYKNSTYWHFPRCTMVKTLLFQCRGHEFDPWLGN